MVIDARKVMVFQRFMEALSPIQEGFCCFLQDQHAPLCMQEQHSATGVDGVRLHPFDLMEGHGEHLPVMGEHQDEIIHSQSQHGSGWHLGCHKSLNGAEGMVFLN